VDFDFDADQDALRDAVRTTLSRALPHERLREVVDGGGPFPDDLWRQFADLGWTALLVPEQFGGLGRGLVDMTVVMEEMGRLPLPGPFYSSAVLATLVAVRLQASDLLEGLASGATRGTVAVEEIGSAGDPLADVRTVASRGDDGWVLDGLKPVVLDGEGADWVIVVARDDSGVAAYLVDQPAATTVPGMDPTRALARLELVSTPARRIGPDGDQSAVLRRALDDAAVMLCAELVGACDAAFALTSDYVKARVQFGRPIGSFQALKHILADISFWAEVSTAAVAAAADAVADARPTASEIVSIAKAYAGDAGTQLAQQCLQVHGGIGFTWEHDLHFYLRRLAADRVLYGDPDWHRERICRIHGL
jgi:alkylation response protein AidB-like acyl-CoA dehydrogenase